MSGTGREQASTTGGTVSSSRYDESAVSIGAEALWRAFNDDRPLPPELRSDHEKAVRAVLDAVLPRLDTDRD